MSNESPPKPPLNRERVLAAAVELADEIGIEALTIRRLASVLGVGPMSIYHHVPSKDEIVDGMVDVVFTEIALPPEDLDWRAAMKVRCSSAREALARHRWAAPLMESRMSPGPANLRHHDAVLGCLLRGGLSLPMVAHAYAAIDAFVYGFAFSEANLPDLSDGGFGEAAEEVAAAFSPDDYPSLVTFAVEHVLQPDYDFGASFDFGLDLILDGLERANG